jgi:hypothetical protein
MAFALTEFKSNLKQGGARPSLFSVEIQYPQGLRLPPTASKFLIKATTIPASTIGTHEIFFHGKAIKVAGDRTFDTLDTTIINDEDFGIRATLEKWIDFISDHKLNKRVDQWKGQGETAEYKGEVIISQYSKAGESLHHYHLIGAFPSALSTINLDWGTQEIEEFTCTWTFDRWMPGSKPHLLSAEVTHGTDLQKRTA